MAERQKAKEKGHLNFGNFLGTFSQKFRFTGLNGVAHTGLEPGKMRREKYPYEGKQVNNKKLFGVTLSI